MASGLFALLDDVATLAKAAAASVDDIAAGAAKASAKSAGVVIDDAAVTPQYVQGVSAHRELSVIKRIAYGSVKNKFLFIIPVAMVMSQFAPWVLPILLIIGGSYLVFEGAEKVLPWLGLGHGHGAEHEAIAGEHAEEVENRLVAGAVRTDLILSTEIMLISLSNIDTDSFVTRLGTLIVVALLMTVAVYGAVALLIRMDDFGVKLATRKSAFAQKFGQGLVTAMPKVFSVISVVGTVAMLWVGGHLLVAAPHDLGFHLLYDLVHEAEHAVHGLGGFAVWVVDTLISAIVGLMVGLGIVAVVSRIQKARGKGH